MRVEIERTERFPIYEFLADGDDSYDPNSPESLEVDETKFRKWRMIRMAYEEMQLEIAKMVREKY